MLRSALLLMATTTCAFTSTAQKDTSTQRECKITGGIGFAGATKNTQSLGKDVWVQLDYRLSKNISIATEFENMNYKITGYYADLPVSPNEINTVDNNFSLLLKYHIPIKSRLQIAFSSGWTYTTRQSDYFIYENDGVSEHWFRNVTSFNDYRIPLLVEIEYGISKKLYVEARGKYNLNPQNGDTYSTGIGLSLKL
jgi:hypothetical protein